MVVILDLKQAKCQQSPAFTNQAEPFSNIQAGGLNLSPQSGVTDGVFIKVTSDIYALRDSTTDSCWVVESEGQIW